MNFESYLNRSGWGTSSATWSDILELGQGGEIAQNYLRQEHSDKAHAYLHRHGDSLRKQIDTLTKSYLENPSSGVPAAEYVKLVNQAVTIATALKPGAIYDPPIRRTGSSPARILSPQTCSRSPGLDPTSPSASISSLRRQSCQWVRSASR